MDSADALSSLIGLIYDASLDPARWPNFLEALAQSIGARTTVFMHHDAQHPRGSITASFRLDFEAQRLYDEHFGAIDPWVAGATSQHIFIPGVVHIGEELATRTELARTEFYNDLAKPFNVTRVLSAVVRQDQQTFASISAQNGERDASFAERDRNLLRQLMPHLQRSLQIHRRVHGVDVFGKAVADALDRLPHAIILVRANGTILLANRPADRILRNADGLVSTRQGIRASEGMENTQLQRLIWATAKTSAACGRSSGGALRLSRPSGRRQLLVVVTPLRLTPSTGSHNAERLAGIFVTDPEETMTADIKGLRLLWKLTLVEGEIAGLLAGGHNLRDIAEAHAISINTVRWHLRHIFEKTETRTQSELVRLLTLFPSQLGNRDPST